MSNYTKPLKNSDLEGMYSVQVEPVSIYDGTDYDLDFIKTFTDDEIRQEYLRRFTQLGQALDE